MAFSKRRQTLKAWSFANKLSILAALIVIAIYAVFAANFPGLTEFAMYVAAGWYWMGAVLVPWVERQLQKLVA